MALSVSLWSRVQAALISGVRSSARLDRRHVVVGEAEMMADLVDQHMAHGMDQILAGLPPVVEQRPAIEKGHVGLVRQILHALAVDGDAAIEAEQVERALELHVALGLFVGKLLDPYHHAFGMLAERGRDRLERLIGDRVDVGECGRLGGADAHGADVSGACREPQGGLGEERSAKPDRERSMAMKLVGPARSKALAGLSGWSEIQDP